MYVYVYVYTRWTSALCLVVQVLLGGRVLQIACGSNSTAFIVEA